MKRKHRPKEPKEYKPGKYASKNPYKYTSEIPSRESIRREGDRIARSNYYD